MEEWIILSQMKRFRLSSDQEMGKMQNEGVITCENGEARNLLTRHLLWHRKSTSNQVFASILFSLSRWSFLQPKKHYKKRKPGRWERWGGTVSRQEVLHVCPSLIFKATLNGGITQFCRRNSSSYQLHTSSNLSWGRMPDKWENWSFNPALCPGPSVMSVTLEQVGSAP